MTPVQADWLSVILGPIIVICLGTTLFAMRSASKRGKPLPGWARTVQLVGAGCVILVAVAQMSSGG